MEAVSQGTTSVATSTYRDNNSGLASGSDSHSQLVIEWLNAFSSRACKVKAVSIEGWQAVLRAACFRKTASVYLAVKEKAKERSSKMGHVASCTMGREKRWKGNGGIVEVTSTF